MFVQYRKNIVSIDDLNHVRVSINMLILSKIINLLCCLISEKFILFVVVFHGEHGSVLFRKGRKSVKTQ